MTDFVMIDLLPPGAILDQVALSSAFEANPTCRYEVIENYNNSGQTAVIFRADELELVDPKMELAYLMVTVNDLISEDKLVNDVFIKVGNENFRYGNPTADPRLDGATYSKALTSTAISKPTEVVARKYIKRAADTYWSSTGIVTGSLEKFEYKLRVLNNTERTISGLKVIDVLPHVGDTAIVSNQAGERTPRKSEFENTYDWQKGVTVPDGYTVYYLNEPIGELTGQVADFEAALNWELSGSADTTAIKIVANEGTVIAENSAVEFIIPMIAPADKDLKLGAKRAYNSFARTDSLIGGYVEPNRVYNEMHLPKGKIMLTKVSREAYTTDPQTPTHLTQVPYSNYGIPTATM